MGSGISEAELRRFIAGPYRSILKVVTVATGSRVAAEDAVHEALARACERSNIDHLEKWVLTVALNVSRSRWRKVRREVPLGELVPGTVDDVLPDIDLRLALDRLPRRQREVVVLHYLLDLSVAETAEVIGLSEGGVKHALFAGRRSLASVLRTEDLMEEVPRHGD
jgi:DNA-directed RNA polymerase specialized sigma24 family protein